jgi:3-hydroxyisobutyrate dehydrogenase-like beta-hydroxyacid dehydrogenase
MRISVLGLGRMGAPMARNLVEVGHEVTVFNRTRERTPALMGVRVADTVAEAVRDAQVALTMVSDGEAECSLTFGKGGLLAHLYAGAIHLCMSTIDVETSRRLAEAHAEAGQGYVAAPVFGRPGAVVSRHLWIVAGGPDAQVMRCLPIFEALGRGITRVGTQAELAHALKLGGNLLTVAMVEALSEVLAYGEKAGMAPADYLRLLNTAIFKSPMMDAYGGLIVRRAFDPPDLKLSFALNDVQSALEASAGFATALPMAELLQQRLEEAATQGWGDLDVSVLARPCRIDAGLEPGNGIHSSTPSSNGAAANAFIGYLPEGEIELELSEVTHFELIQNRVWAWARGKRYRTVWKHLAEVEQAFPSIAFLRLHRQILMHSEAALSESPEVAWNDPPAEETAPSAPASGPGLYPYPALDGEERLTLDLTATSHFERLPDGVWAWVQGKRYLTQWNDLVEVESAFNHVILLRAQRSILLNPEAVLSLTPLFGGRTKVKVSGDLELSVTRSATPRLKELLGV